MSKLRLGMGYVAVHLVSVGEIYESQSRCVVAYEPRAGRQHGRLIGVRNGKGG